MQHYTEDMLALSEHWLIKDIRHVSTGLTRTDGRYPHRIGSTVFTPFILGIGFSAFIDYQKDNAGNPRGGTLQTSNVQSVEITTDETGVHHVAITTLNSIFELESTNS